MKIDDFINKVIIEKETQRRFLLYDITAPIIEYVEESFYDDGPATIYRYHTKDGGHFLTGDLVFEDTELTEPFKKAYERHCQSEDGCWELYCYWSEII